MRTLLCAAALSIFALSSMPAQAEYISYRDNHDIVRSAQWRLEQLGFYFGNIDGVNGPMTHNAIAAFQRANGLAVTGRLDFTTQSALVPTYKTYAYYYPNGMVATPVTYVTPLRAYNVTYAQPVVYATAASLPVAAPIAYTYSIPDSMRYGGE